MLSSLSFPGTTPSYFLLLDWLPFLILLCKLFLLYSVFTCCCSLSPRLGPLFLFLPYKFSLNNLINFDRLNDHICQWISNLYLILGPLIWAPDWWCYYLLQGSTLDSTMPSSVWHLGLSHPYTCFFSWAPNLLKRKNLGIILNFPPIFYFSLTADPCISFSLDSVYVHLFHDFHGTALAQATTICYVYHYAPIWSPRKIFFKPSPLCSWGDLLKA